MSEDNFPLISVVIAAYNGQRYIGAQLDSIINQTYPNIEIIVVDDCSTDETVAIIEGYRHVYPQIRLVRNEKNIGYIKNFEKGLLLSTGDFIAPSDQDDVWKAEKLMRLYEEIGDHPIIYCNSELIDGQGRTLGKKLSGIKRLVDFNDPLNYAIGGSVPGHAMLIRRNIVQESVPLPEMIPHDYWIAYIATFHGVLKFLDEPMVLYRQHETNVFGAVKGNGKKLRKKYTTGEKTERARERMRLLYEKCPPHLPQKEVYRQLYESYTDFTPAHNWKRMQLFLQNREKILAFKHRSLFRKLLFCVKMFATVK